MKSKPWQIMVIVLGLVIAGGVTAWNLIGSEDGEIPDSYYLIDVESGQIYRVNRQRVRLAIPAPNPETGRIALIGLSKDDKGFYVSDRDLGTIKVLDEGVKNNAVDAQTGELKDPSKPIVDYKKKS